MEPAALVATDLACRRGERLLFRGLSFTLEPGEALQVAGPNGTGKSSLLRILGGLLRPWAGTVTGNEGASLLDERLPLDPDLPLGRALAFWERVDGVAYATRAPSAFAPLGTSPVNGGGLASSAVASLGASPVNGGGWGLEGLLDVPVRFLSTGQRKRAAICLSMARGPALWLLDEPLNGLDTAAAAALQERVAAYLGGGGKAVIASHQPFTVPGLRRLELADFAP